MNAPQHTPPQDPNEQLAKDVAKAGALGCLGGVGAFGVFALAVLVALVLLVLLGFGLLYLTCGGH
ncbi:MAG: hypothetical protein J0L92_10445 [Deltaproteobacteria bacterium]|nr:hypothetical protein [Deltaproteobacteria bacterium]